MIFLVYLFFFSLLSVLIDLSMLFSIVSLFLGAILCFNSSSPLQGIAICAFGLLNLISSLCYHSKKMCPKHSSIYSYVKQNFLSISIATFIFAIPICYIIIKSKITLEISPIYIFIVNLFISWAILFKIVDRIFIHNRETKEVVLEDYFTIYRSRKALSHIYTFKFKDSPDFYSTRMWKYRIFINKVGSKFSCTFGKGIFGTSYITSIKLIEDAGKHAPTETDPCRFFPFRKRSLTKKDYSFLNILIPLLLTIGVVTFSFGIFLLYIAHIGPQNLDVRLLKYIELYKVIGAGGIISGTALVIIFIFLLIKFIRKK